MSTPCAGWYVRGSLAMNSSQESESNYVLSEGSGGQSEAVTGVVYSLNSTFHQDGQVTIGSEPADTDLRLIQRSAGGTHNCECWLN